MDARSLLRAERTTRQINHPHAHYAAGKLRCAVCQIPVKAESLWDAHLRTPSHIASAKAVRAREAAAAAAQEEERARRAARKRKASDDEASGESDGSVVNRRKKARAVGRLGGIPEVERVDGLAGTEHTDVAPIEPVKQIQDQIQAQAQVQVQDTVQGQNGGAQGVDDELAAFERELADMDQEAENTRRIEAAATISAKPVSAEELAARAREEMSNAQTKGAREEELRVEKEEAQDAAADEMDRMGELEARVAALRRRKEEVLAAKDKAPAVAEIEVEDDIEVENEDEDDDDEEDDVWNNWGR